MIWIATLFMNFANAEYRAFELVIANSTTGQERVVISNLDPRQYRRYFPVKLDETITYRNTWMCKGNTSHMKPTCPAPKDGEEPAPNTSQSPKA
jgi:hypothetical protein